MEEAEVCFSPCPRKVSERLVPTISDSAQCQANDFLWGVNDVGGMLRF